MTIANFFRALDSLFLICMYTQRIAKEGLITRRQCERHERTLVRCAGFVHMHSNED